MARIRVYDLPTRLFHWSYAVGLASTLGIAATTDHHGPVFPYHKIIGLIVIVMVLLRLVWGFVGTRYARFASFLLKPRDLIA